VEIKQKGDGAILKMTVVGTGDTGIVATSSGMYLRHLKTTRSITTTYRSFSPTQNTPPHKVK
jgi:hypothetical protein